MVDMLPATVSLLSERVVGIRYKAGHVPVDDVGVLLSLVFSPGGSPTGRFARVAGRPVDTYLKVIISQCRVGRVLSAPGRSQPNHVYG